jgi:hypothetical protein
VATLSHLTKPHEKENRPKVRATGARRAERNAAAEPQKEPEKKSESKKESGEKKGKS